jgi:hypothetical protein
MNVKETTSFTIIIGYYGIMDTAGIMSTLFACPVVCSCFAGLVLKKSG